MLQDSKCDPSAAKTTEQAEIATPTAPAGVQQEQTIGPGKYKVDKLGQDEEWARVPELDFEKNIFTPQANEGGGVHCPPHLSIL